MLYLLTPLLKQEGNFFSQRLSSRTVRAGLNPPLKAFVKQWRLTDAPAGIQVKGRSGQFVLMLMEPCNQLSVRLGPVCRNRGRRSLWKEEISPR
jgi:hypothetical protein